MKAKWEESFPSWPEEKSSSPFGQIPYLIEIDENGKTFTLAQSKAIERYLSRKFGLFGDNEKETAKIDEISECFVEIQEKFAKMVTEKDSDKKKEMESHLFLKDIPNFIQNQEKFLIANGSNGHFVGEKTTLADIALIHIYERINYHKQETFTREISPQMQKAYETITNNPRLSPYLTGATRNQMIP
ncbi:hypothetical protein HK096_008465 [Nowakowskiella sp. JEL0078]|nr:hypothetical protein HK096_008465 [Nowakowskiella sp. JEL0078]